MRSEESVYMCACEPACCREGGWGHEFVEEEVHTLLELRSLVVNVSVRITGSLGSSLKNWCTAVRAVCIRELESIRTMKVCRV